MKTLKKVLFAPILAIAYLITLPFAIAIMIYELRDEERIFNRYGG